MKQKIVVKVQMNCIKCRSQALQVAANLNGVDSVGFEGKDKENIVVVGDGVDAVELTTSLRKKARWADIISVAEVKAQKQ